jgi:mannose/fructose/N-acetylgalactosamine-specific phosphotransferase system component IIC
MNYLKFTQYAYLLAGFIFAFDAYQKYQDGDTNKAYISIGFAAVGVFMFFFRRNFGRKFQERNKKP